jgi:4a-hydroxytetrahydrobiopterin dehydratase
MKDTPLAERHCEAAATLIGTANAKQRIALMGLMVQLHPAWQLRNAPAYLERAIKFPDFARTLRFVNALAKLADAENHHPDVLFGYDYCRVRFSTHAVGGLTLNDFICAARVDTLFEPVDTTVRAQP